MAIITSGTLVDAVRGQSVPGGAWGGATFLTVNNSLPPGTTPDIAVPVLLSVQVLSAIPGIGVVRGQSNINSVGVFGPTLSGASQPTLAFDLVSWVFWSGAR